MRKRGCSGLEGSGVGETRTPGESQPKPESLVGVSCLMYPEDLGAGGGRRLMARRTAEEKVDRSHRKGGEG